MIDQSKTYRTKRGDAVRIYATDGSTENEYPIHGAIHRNGGWDSSTWTATGQHSRLAPGDLDIIESDPHGILPRHRELLAEAMVEHKHDFGEWVEIVRTGTFTSLSPSQHVALIALARLESSLRSEVGE